MSVENFSLMDEEDEKEKWFYDSFKRYKQLYMFEYMDVITHMALASPTSMCVAGMSKSNDLVELSLPQKLTVAPHRKGLEKKSDLNLLRGASTAAPVTEMKVFPKKQIVIVSEEKQCGATVYTLEANNSEQIKRVSHVSCELISPHIALNDEGMLLLSSTSEHQFVVADIEAEKIITKSSLDCNGSGDGGLQPCFVSSNVAAFCEKITGNIILQDIRHNKCSIDNAQINTRRARALWTLTSSWNTENNCENPKLCLASNTGSLFLYDIRNLKHALFEDNVHVPTSNLNIKLTLHFQPKDDTKLSLSGFNENVYILKILDTNSYKTEFVHNGHGKQDYVEDGVDSTVTTHMWYDGDTVLSASQDKSLHCWQFVADQA